MPRLQAAKERIEGPPPMPEQMVTFRLDGFKPAAAKKGGSVNLNPVMKIINSAEFNDRIIFENLNTKGEWIWPEFCHALGVPLEKDSSDNYVFPGDFVGPEDDPSKWQYTGPLLGQIGQCYIVQTDNTKGGVKNAVKFYVCKLPGCSHKHKDNLIG